MTTAHIPPPTFSFSDWERYAICYDSLSALSPYTAMLEEVTSHVVRHQGSHILDASCGTGNFETTLMRLYAHHPFTITGVDASKEMLSRAITKCRDFTNISFHEANLNQTLAYPKACFGQVVSLNTLYAVENPRRTLSEFYRVLEPRGHLVLVTPHKDYENGAILKSHCGSIKPDAYWAHLHESPEREEKLIREAITDEHVVQDLILVAQYNRHIAKNAVFHFPETEELVSLLSEVGFSITTLSSTYAAQDFFIIAQKGT